MSTVTGFGCVRRSSFFLGVMIALAAITFVVPSSATA